MSVRVNLLRPEEIRAQATVSREVLVKGGRMIGIGAALIGLVVGGLQYHRTSSSYKSMKARWAVLESPFQEVQKIEDQYKLNQRFLGELEAWGKTRLDWRESLEALQEMVPPNLQFTRLAINGDVIVAANKPSSKEKPATPIRVFNLRLEGVAVGTLSDQDVISFVEEIRRSAHFESWVASVKLQGMQLSAHPHRDQSEEERIFRVDASSKERMMR